jgi:hypothetical protein
MTRIFLINVGANSSHQSKARCPLFPDGSFIYVPFPLEGNNGTYPYPKEAWPFTNGLCWYQTHADPDWENLTYGDDVRNPRAAALKTAERGDILVFWSLLWDNPGDDWTSFTNRQSWHLIGSLRVEEILFFPGDSLSDVSSRNRERAACNVHFRTNTLADGNIVFIGDLKHSRLFEYAVPLVRNLTRSTLLYRIFRTANGERLPLIGKHWNSYTRTCRAICDLDDHDGHRRAVILRDAIAELNDFNLLANV